MKKISGNKLLVKALKEEGVDTLFGYPGACTIDISDELYKQDFTKVILPRQFSFTKAPIAKATPKTIITAINDIISFFFIVFLPLQITSSLQY